MTNLSNLIDNFNSIVLLLFGVLAMLCAVGFSLYSAGMVQAKNTTSILVKNTSALTIVCFLYLIFDDNFVYGVDHSHLNKTACEFFQLMLAFVPLAIIALATAERLKLWAYIIFVAVMAASIYPLQAHWLWGKGFLYQLGYIDRAGASTLYLTGAIAGLVGILFLGPRLNKYSEEGQRRPILGANLPFTVLGALMIWIGAFGINAGMHFITIDNGNMQQLPLIFLNTSCAAATGLITSLFITRIYFGLVDLTLLLNGALAGIVAMAAFPANPHLTTTILISAVASFLALIFIIVLDRNQIDDPAGSVSTFGISAIWGLLSNVINLDYGQLTQAKGVAWTWYMQLLSQCYGLALVIVWVGITSGLLWFSIKFIIGLRFSEAEERRGLDIVDYGMPAYPEFTQTER